MLFKRSKLTRLKFQRKRLTLTRANGPVLNTVRRDIRQQLEAEADAEYWEILASVINLLRDPINEQM